MIVLGSYDRGLPQNVRDGYLKRVEETTRLKPGDVVDGPDKLQLAQYAPAGQETMTVAEVQRGLAAAGFFPGAKTDGICGYRTLSAMRLFQEYVRTREDPSVVPDGRFGPVSQKLLKRWLDERLKPSWGETVAAWKAGSLANTEYTDWLALLEGVKSYYSAQPSAMAQMVSAYVGASDTKKVAQWDARPEGIHLIGIRRDARSGRFDDLFVLLIKGLVFKFQGSTDPGATNDPRGAPFLVHGQHDYHFGWHQRTYLALKPLGKGVLVVRSKGDFRLDDADLREPLEANATINVHWGGRGMRADVKNWSEGCQVINGSMYLDERNERIDCSAFAALNNREVAENRSKTRGAYNVVLDLVTALGSDLPGETVNYTLLVEQDLDRGTDTLSRNVADARAWVGTMVG